MRKVTAVYQPRRSTSRQFSVEGVDEVVDEVVDDGVDSGVDADVFGGAVRTSSLGADFTSAVESLCSQSPIPRDNSCLTYSMNSLTSVRSEERHVGKECRL